MNIKYNTVLGLVVVVQQNSSNALLLRNIQNGRKFTSWNSNGAHTRFEIIFFGFRFICINTVMLCIIPSVHFKASYNIMIVQKNVQFHPSESTHLS